MKLTTQTGPKFWVLVKLVLVYTTIFVLSAPKRLRCVKSHQSHKSGGNAHMPSQALGELLIAWSSPRCELIGSLTFRQLLGRLGC